MDKAPDTLLLKYEALTYAESPSHRGQEILSMASIMQQVGQRTDEEGSACQAQPGRLAIWGRLHPTLCTYINSLSN